jgi:hypothetical protein
MLVTIVAVPNADNTGLDAERMEKVEDLHPDVARRMLDLGTAREPSEDELAAYRGAQDAPKYDNGGDLPAGETQAHNSTDRAVAIATPATATTDLRSKPAPAETPAA